MKYEQIVLSNEFTKHSIWLPLKNGRNFHFSVHDIDGTDKVGPHDHPWDFIVFIAEGGYTELVYKIIDEETGKYYCEPIERKKGDVFTIKATHIHEIIHLPEGSSLSIIIPLHNERQWGFWRFRGDGTMYFEPFKK